MVEGASLVNQTSAPIVNADKPETQRDYDDSGADAEARLATILGADFRLASADMEIVVALAASTTFEKVTLTFVGSPLASTVAIAGGESSTPFIMVK